MDSYQAQLTVGADPTPIDTTVVLDGPDLEIAASGESLGRWKIADLGLERVLGGYRMRVEGESATLKFSEPERFADALGASSGTVQPAARPEKVKKEKATREKTTREKPEKPARARGRNKTSPVDSASTPVADATPDTGEAAIATSPPRESSVGWLDRNLEVAQKRYGKYVPDWVFSKGGIVVALGVLILLLAKPEWFSVLFLVVAAIGLITSAIALLDQVIAVRIFRGGFTPIQGLIVSLSIGLVGMVLGAIAR